MEVVREHAIADTEESGVAAAMLLTIYLHRGPPITNARVQEWTGLDPWTVKKFMRPLRASGIVRGSAVPPYLEYEEPLHTEIALALDSQVAVGRIRAIAGDTWADTRYWVAEAPQEPQR